MTLCDWTAGERAKGLGSAMPLLESCVETNSQAAKTKSLSLCLGGQLVAMELGQMVACVRSL